ncbi:hypothetical protein pEaSNUABM11_00287 [Erwinia phage pEa_SNUABM_11]|nr:hypothetical protein pEaSNUABM11_00287 [Erwinia phage pEa_SNUABM_11]
MALENAYTGNVFRSFDLISIKAQLELARKLNQTVAQSEEVHYVVETADVTPFPLPIVIENDVYVDARTFTTLDKTGALKIRNPIEHALRLDQARWELVWKRNNGKLGALMAQLPYHHEVFSKWVSDTISHAFSLAPYQSGQVQALAALFSVGQFYNNFSDDAQMFRLQQVLSRDLGIPFNIFETVTGNTEHLFPRDITEFVETLKEADITPRLKDFSTLTLVQALSTSFFGVSYDRQLVTSAIEYPPSLLVMIKACLNENMYNRSRLGGVVKKTSVAKKKDKFLFTYNTILNQNSKPTNIQ